MLKILKNRKCPSRIKMFTEVSNICVWTHASFIAQYNEVVRKIRSLHKCRWGVYLFIFLFIILLFFFYCLYDVLTNILVYLFNDSSSMLSNEVGYNYDAETKGSRLNIFVQAEHSVRAVYLKLNTFRQIK